MGEVKDLKGAKDLSHLAKTPGEKVEDGALEFIQETREALTIAFKQMVDMVAAINELFQRTDYLFQELNKLKGVDLNNGTDQGNKVEEGNTAQGTQKVNNADTKGNGTA
jgi:selenocysteine lyase/cysteine desulfurase